MIRHAELECAGQVLELLEQHGLPTEGVVDHLGTAIVALKDGRVIGTAALELYGDDALLRSVAIDRSARGQGLGARLTRRALDLARRRAVKTVYLLTETAAAYFPRFGFEPIARSEVPQAVRSSVEFTSACPMGACVMRARIQPYGA